MSDTQGAEFLIQWHLTERCNLACSHCYQDGTIRGELPAADVVRLLAEFKETFETWKAEYGMIFAPRLQLTGGEPLLRRDLFEIIGNAKSMGYALSLLTNGTMIGGRTAERIASAGIELVQISIEGPPFVHDGIRGEGCFASAVEAIERLSGLGQSVSINVTLSRLNARHIADLVELGKRAGAGRVSFSRLVPSGSGRSLASASLSMVEIRDIYRELRTLGGSDIEVACRDPLFSLIGEETNAKVGGGELPVGGCSAGVAAITVLPDGTAMACRRLGVEIGNLTETPFRELWAESPGLWSLRDRDEYTGKCGKCARWSVCRGCRAVAYAFSTIDGNPDLHADDPHCWVEE